jgi:hypothetical protein
MMIEKECLGDHERSPNEASRGGELINKASRESLGCAESWPNKQRKAYLHSCTIQNQPDSCRINPQTLKKITFIFRFLKDFFFLV